MQGQGEVILNKFVKKSKDNSYGAHSIISNKGEKPNEDISDHAPFKVTGNNLTEERAAEAVFDTFKEIAKQCKDNEEGSTLSLAVSYRNEKNEKIATIGGLGDSSAFIVICDQNQGVVACKLINHYHHYENPEERRRFFLLGGHSVSKSGQSYRLNGNLVVLRSVGDKTATKQDPRLHMPDIFHVKIPANFKAYVVLSSDGFTDAFMYKGGNLEKYFTELFRKSFSSKKTLSDMALHLCEDTVKEIAKLGHKHDDTTLRIIEVGEENFVAYLADGHGAKKERNWQNHTIDYISNNLFKIFDENIKNKSNDNARESGITFLKNDTEWQVSDNNAFALETKAIAYPVLDSWFYNAPSKEVEVHLINAFITLEHIVNQKVIEDIANVDNIGASTYEKARDFMLDLAGKSGISKETFMEVWIRLPVYKKARLGNELERLFISALRECVKNKSFSDLERFFLSTKFNAINFGILLGNLKVIMLHFELDADPAFKEIYKLADKYNQSASNAIVAIHEIATFQKGKDSRMMALEFEKVTSKVREKTSSFFRSLSTVTKSLAVSTMAEKIEVGSKAGVRTAVLDVISSMFANSLEQSMTKLKSVLHKYNVCLELSEFPADNDKLSDLNVAKEPSNENTETFETPKGLQ